MRAIDLELICQGCKKRPEELDEYIEMAKIEEMNGPSEFVWKEEGTLNRKNGHFLCTDCYIAAGMPSSPRGWVCP